MTEKQTDRWIEMALGLGQLWCVVGQSSPSFLLQDYVNGRREVMVCKEEGARPSERRPK